MTIMLELACSKDLRAHPVKNQWILSGNSKILHLFSEDVLTANVFGILKNLDPRVWLVSFFRTCCHFSEDEFPHLYDDDNYSKFNVSLWLDLDKPPSRLEGITQADVFIETKHAALLIESKGSASLQKRVSADASVGERKYWWDQAIRNIAQGYAYTQKHCGAKDFFFVVLSMREKEETFIQYENWVRIKEQIEKRILRDPELRIAFPQESIDDICKRLSRQIRWAKWSGLKEALEQSHFEEEGEFKPQGRFCKDMTEYLDFKTKLWTELLTKPC